MQPVPLAGRMSYRIVYTPGSINGTAASPDARERASGAWQPAGLSTLPRARKKNAENAEAQRAAEGRENRVLALPVLNNQLLVKYL